MQVVELDRSKAQVGDVTDCGAHIIRRFPGKAEDEMGTEVEVAQPGPTDSIVKSGNTMAAIDESKGLVVGRFKAEFKPKISA